MTKRQLKIDKFIWTFIFTIMMFLAFAESWMWLEIFILGEANNNLVDNIIAIPIIVSLWFNAKSIVDWILRKGNE